MKDTRTYTLIRARRRTISLHIESDGSLVVKAPFLIPLFVINRFINEKNTWISKQQKEMKRMPRKRKGSIKEGDEFPYLGNDFRIHIGNNSAITVTDRLNIPTFLMFRIKKELESWYITRAKTIISARIMHYAEELQTTYGNITFSDTRSKWGSCSRDNSLQFSWRLIMAPLLVIDYVVVHELVHTRVKNHSVQFWKEVRRYKPAYKQYIKWLRNNSRRLHAIEF